MRIHAIKHASFEVPAYIEIWGKENNCTFSYTDIYKNEKLPKLDDFDLLLIMGGPMSVNETQKYGWLNYELKLIKDSIENNKAVLGVCLGAQLIAKVLGSKIYTGKHPEIGWFPVMFEKKNLASDFKACLPDYLTTFHWHGETFETPREAIGFGSSVNTPNQCFIYRDKVIALQFHLEVTEKTVEDFLKNMGNEVVEGRYIQPECNIREGLTNISKNNKIMAKVLSYLSLRIK